MPEESHQQKFGYGIGDFYHSIILGAIVLECASRY